MLSDNREETLNSCKVSLVRENSNANQPKKSIILALRLVPGAQIRLYARTAGNHRVDRRSSPQPKPRRGGLFIDRETHHNFLIFHWSGLQREAMAPPRSLETAPSGVGPSPLACERGGKLNSENRKKRDQRAVLSGTAPQHIEPVILLGRNRLLLP